MVAAALFQQLLEIGAVAAFLQWLRQLFQLFGIDPPLPPGHFLGTPNLEALPVLQCADITRCVVERVAGARVQPGHATTHQFDLEESVFQVHLIEVGDLKFSPR